MVDLKHSDLRIIEEAFRTSDPGYVLDFSNRTVAEYFGYEFGIDIELLPEYGRGSKMSRLREFFRVSSAPLVTRAMRSLWEYREANISKPN
jgi:hypothetical protein